MPIKDRVDHPFSGSIVDHLCSRCSKPREVHYARKKRIDLGIDGEGITTWVNCQRPSDEIVAKARKGTFQILNDQWQEQRHLYTLMCASAEHGEQWSIENPKGLSTRQCLDFIFSLPPTRDAHIFAYAFNYDLTKILQDVDDHELYLLFRPEQRVKALPNGKIRYRPVYWPRRGIYHDASLPQYRFHWLAGKFVVGKRMSEHNEERWETRTIFDIFKFFQGKFTAALVEWKVETEQKLEAMRVMKDKRSKFDRLSMAEIKEYCLDECRYMASLATKLQKAHVDAGIPLTRSFAGAGTTAALILNKLGVKDHIDASREIEQKWPDAVQYAILNSFFGGRFENSVIGTIDESWSYDISSAYPYQIATNLPCLLHGRWEHTTKRHVIDNATTAVVRYRLGYLPRKERGSWGPFPFRSKSQNICYPAMSGGGWIWRDEYLAGEPLFPNVEFREAWVYHTDCDCAKKLFYEFPQYYRERVRIGKDGPGIVIKLGMNAGYGKFAQFIGGRLGPFTSYMWAGIITAGTRAQILGAIGFHKDRANLLSIATDGICTRERLELPKPKRTGTEWCKCPRPKDDYLAQNSHLYQLDGDVWRVNKPLGGWEEKHVDRPVFFGRPGIYFPVGGSKVKEFRARGIGREVLHEQAQVIIDAWRNRTTTVDGVDKGVIVAHVRDLSRFNGAKLAVNSIGTRNHDYGQWIDRPVILSLHPMPKRRREQERVNDTWAPLQLRALRADLESSAYDKKVISPEAAQLKQAQEELAWQPDADLTELGDCD